MGNHHEGAARSAEEQRAALETQWAERELRKSREQFTAIFDQAGSGIAQVDADGRFRLVNDRFCETVGRRREELLGLRAEEVTHADDVAATRAAIGRALAGERHVMTETRYVRPDGTSVWASNSVTAVGGAPAGGAPTGAGPEPARSIVVVSQDVTARKTAEAHHRLLVAVDDAVRPLDDADAITAASVRLLGEFLGADRCAYADVLDDQDTFEIRGDHASGLAPLTGRFRLSDFGPEALRRHRAGEPFVADDVAADPRLGPAERAAYAGAGIAAAIAVPLHKAGRFVAGVAVHQATPRRWAAAQVELVRAVADRCWESIERARITRSLRDSEARFRQLADAMPQIVFMADPAGRVDYFNRRWYEYTGLPEGAVEFASWRQAHTEEGLGRALVAWNESLATGLPYQIECRLRRRDGELRWHLARALPVRDGAGRIVRWFGTNTDVHDYKLLLERNEQLLESERAARAEAERAGRLKDEFLATLGHELRTPLNAVLGWSQLLRSAGLTDEEDLRQGLETIDRNARAQAQLIEDLLDMSRISGGMVRLDVRPVRPAAVVGAALETVRLAAEAKGVVLQARLDPLAGPVAGDAVRLQQVVWNLLSNAIKFTPPGGRVAVEARRVAGRGGPQVEIAVSDTGEGIRPDFLPHVFERFRQADGSTTRRHGGLGLGLSIARHLTELHGGTVRAESEGEGRGATFTVALPAAIAGSTPDGGVPGAAGAPGADAAADCAALETVKVLAVDDDPDARDLIRRMLEACGAVVRTSASASEALAVLRDFAPDVIVSDLGMPDVDGFEFLRRVRAENAGHRAVALTAFAQSEDRTRALREGFVAHVSKPVEPAKLISTLASVVGRGGAGRGG